MRAVFTCCSRADYHDKNPWFHMKTEAPIPAGATPPAIFLRQILERRRERVRQAQSRQHEAELRRLAKRRQPRDFIAALRRGGTTAAPAIIAELKRASPSRGLLRADYHVASLAAAYARAGATALSVLTEEDFFQGELEHLRQAHQAVELPLLRKDFIFCAYQIWEAAAAGADAVLLIAAMLDDAALRELQAAAAAAGLAALVEVHDAAELRRACEAGAQLIGVNNRDLRSFQVDAGLCLRLAPSLPPAVTCIAESGIGSPAMLARLRAAGYHAALIGEHFMQAADPGAALAALLDGLASAATAPPGASG